MDLFGPIKIKSLCDNHFIFILVDDFSRFTWIFFLEHKDKVFSHFHVLEKGLKKKKIF